MILKYRYLNISFGTKVHVPNR